MALRHLPRVLFLLSPDHLLTQQHGQKVSIVSPNQLTTILLDALENSNILSWNPLTSSTRWN